MSSFLDENISDVDKIPDKNKEYIFILPRPRPVYFMIEYTTSFNILFKWIILLSQKDYVYPNLLEKIKNLIIQQPEILQSRLQNGMSALHLAIYQKKN